MALRNAFELIATENTLATVLTRLTSVLTELQGVLDVAGPLTNAELRASAVPISGPFLTNTELRASAVPVSGPLTDVQLRATALPVSGPITDAQLRAAAVVVRDDYQAAEVLEDQVGANTVLSFTFSAAVQLVVMQSTGADLVARAHPTGGTPDADTGVRLEDGVPVYVPVNTSNVKVYAPTGTTINVYGLRSA